MHAGSTGEVMKLGRKSYRTIAAQVRLQDSSQQFTAHHFRHAKLLFATPFFHHRDCHIDVENLFLVVWLKLVYSALARFQRLP